MSRLLIFVCSLLLTACATAPIPATPPPSQPKLILVLVGGNSEAIHDGGLWKLYKGSLHTNVKYGLLTNLEAQTKLARSDIATYYFSWTGDDESQRETWFPSHGSWITGGAAWIEKSMRGVLSSNPSAEVAIFGWSNGGATAYELACTLSAKRAPGLLVTLDPVSWTTRPCAYYSAGRTLSPAPWINVYTSSGLLSRLNAGNIIALIGRAWDADKLPSEPPSGSLHKSDDTNHGATEAMWVKVLKDEAFVKWAASLAAR
jgi:hypothetical protein